MKRVFTILSVLFFLVFLQSCSKNKEEYSTVLEPYVLNYAGLSEPKIALDNALTKQGVELGRRLFYDKMLSKDNSISCTSCHEQKNAFSDERQFSLGVRNLPGKRQAMAIFNMAWNNNEFFWDGRAHLLRDQALMPIEDELEMDETLENVVLKIKNNKKYTSLFEVAFPNKEISSLTISLALEQFMNSIVSNNSKYDRFLRNEVQLTSSEENGRKLFFNGFDPVNKNISGANCAQCHNGANFENDSYMNNGLDIASNFKDFGREKVTDDYYDRAKFKVPSLRNIEVTAPYMHDGRHATLEEVIEHYDNKVVNSFSLNPTLASISTKGLQLSNQQKEDLIAFLKTLTDYELLRNKKFSDPFK